MEVLLHSQETIYEDIFKFYAFLKPWIIINQELKRDTKKFISVSFRFSPRKFADYENMFIPRCNQDLINSLKIFCDEMSYKNIYIIKTVIKEEFEKYSSIRSGSSFKDVLVCVPERIVMLTKTISLKEYNHRIKLLKYRDKILIDTILNDVITLNFPNKTIQLPKSMALKSKYVQTMVNIFDDQNEKIILEIPINYSDADIKKLVKNLLTPSEDDKDLDIIKFFLLN